MTTVLDALKYAIAKAGADGLCNKEVDCTGCTIGDLFACEHVHEDCEFGKIIHPIINNELKLRPMKHKKNKW